LQKRVFGEELAAKEYEINELREEDITNYADDVYEEEEDRSLFHKHPFLVRMKILMMLAIGVAPSLVVKWMSHL
jgi:lactate dehydrogenase-like 2-hydroxyacid dehydrogenase